MNQDLDELLNQNLELAQRNLEKLESQGNDFRGQTRQLKNIQVDIKTSEKIMTIIESYAWKLTKFLHPSYYKNTDKKEDLNQDEQTKTLEELNEELNVDISSDAWGNIDPNQLENFERKIKKIKEINNQISDQLTDQIEDLKELETILNHNNHDLDNLNSRIGSYM